jgi:hypothetical protein
MELTIKQVGIYTEDLLMSEHQENEALISRIKDSVSQDYDNIGQPIPFSASLQSSQEI